MRTPTQGMTYAFAAAMLLSTAFAAGCANGHGQIDPQPNAVGDLTATMEERAASVRPDPAAYIELVTTKCRELSQYTLRFTRYERRGLFQVMFGPEHIACRFRQRPFAVHMKWLDEDTKYFESTYAEGVENDKVRFVTRWWSPPLLAPPGVNKVGLQAPVFWGEAKRPLTDFGLERLMEQTLTSVQSAGDDVAITYEGIVHLQQTDSTVHHLHLEYAERIKRVPVQELYIDVDTDLPVGTILKFASGRIDAAYFYEDLDANVTLTDDDFLLDAEREEQ